MFPFHAQRKVKYTKGKKELGFQQKVHLLDWVYVVDHRETSGDAQLEFIVSTEKMVCLFTFLVY